MDAPNVSSEADLVRMLLADRDVPCPDCGYSLRGLTGETCPECGVGLRLLVKHEGRGVSLRAAIAMAFAWPVMAFVATLLQVVLSRIWPGPTPNWVHWGYVTDAGFLWAGLSGLAGITAWVLLARAGRSGGTAKRVWWLLILWWVLFAGTCMFSLLSLAVLYN